MKNFAILAMAFSLCVSTLAHSQAVALKEGVYEAKTPKGEPLSITLVKTPDGMIKVSHLGYDFEASLRVGKVLLKNGNPFGKMQTGKLVFQFPVFLSLSMSANIRSEGGGSINIAYYRGEISSGKEGELICTLTKLKDVKKELNPDYDASKFTMENIGLATPPAGKKMEEKYAFQLKAVSE